MPKVPYPNEENGKLVTGNGSFIPICSFFKPLLIAKPSLTVPSNKIGQIFSMLVCLFRLNDKKYALKIGMFSFFSEFIEKIGSGFEIENFKKMF